MFGKGNGGGGMSTRMGKMKQGGGATRTGKMKPGGDKGLANRALNASFTSNKSGDPKIAGHGGNVKAGKYHGC